MISNPNMIFYTCIATGTMILAEFNSKDADLATLAIKCLEKTPNNHISFTHTVRNRSHTFLIDYPFVYFAIYNKKFEYPEALSYLKSVRVAFHLIHKNPDTCVSYNFSSHCFQGEFNPVFHQLLASNVDMEIPFSPRVCKSGNLGSGKRFGSMALLSGGIVSPRSLTKKKKRFGNGDIREGLFENKVDMLDRDLCVSVHRSGALYESSYSGGSYKARRLWKSHVWVVLTLDLVLCLVLFGVWLWICKGFKCVAG